jgi:predicted dehydrogenase/threonine dehydrogenase-like Zn-dependent dehydrogenase
MKAVLQNMKTGDLKVEEVPPPALRRGGILVRVERSLISLGTERAVIALAKKGPLGKAQDRPDLARKVLNKARQEGLWNTYQVVKNLLNSPIPLGYSCAGRVTAVGEEAQEFQVGDRVACAGLNFANHAEIDYVPRNLAARIPAGLSYEAACFVTMGAIAMQGVRLAQLTLGERVVVLGLGLVGQIAAQIARCAGASVMATDVDGSKTELAAALGAHAIFRGDSKDLARAVSAFTGGTGADAVLVCAAAKSDEPVRLAAEMSRLKGRIVVVGDVGLHLDRRACFEKEVNLVVSRSYGPGRYDPLYEARGIDYPLPYVRWTEQRNMESFLELCARGDIRVEPLVTHRFPIEEAETAYQLVTGERKEPSIAIVLGYESAAAETPRLNLKSSPARDASGEVAMGVVGAGQFAKGILLPQFARQKGLQMRAFCTASGYTSRSVAERYGAAFCTSDPAQIIDDPAIDAVLIATRHDEHARLASAALRAGKAVFVEKPLALDEQSLQEVVEACGGGNARLMVGYNRRFSPLAVQMKEFFASAGPEFVVYRVNAGKPPAGSWVYDPVEGGGRILGEVCHFVDTICFLTGSTPKRVYAEAISGGGEAQRDSVTVTLAMANGSVGAIHYLAGGDPGVPKEYVEAYGGERTAILDNFRSLSLHHGNRRRRRRLLNQAKGHAEEAAAFVSAVSAGGPMPIDLATLAAVTQATLLIHRSLNSGGPADFDPEPLETREALSEG